MDRPQAWLKYRTRPPAEQGGKARSPAHPALALVFKAGFFLPDPAREGQSARLAQSKPGLEAAAG